MSTIKVNALRHTGGSSDNISLDSSGRVGIGTATPADYNGNANNLVVGNGSTNEGMTIASTNEGSIFFADGTTGTDEYAGYLQYHHSDNHLRVGIASTEQMRLDSSGNLRFNSGYGSVATAYGVRAWVNFNGTGTVAIRDDGNVSSITDNGTGVYSINFTTAMPDTNYSVFASNIGSVHASYACFVCADNAALATGSCDIELRNYTGSIEDQPCISVAVVR